MSHCTIKQEKLKPGSPKNKCEFAIVATKYVHANKLDIHGKFQPHRKKVAIDIG